MHTAEDSRSSHNSAARFMAMSVEEAAAAANIGRASIYLAIRDGRLEARKFGKRTLITHTALEAFLNNLPRVTDLTPCVRRTAE